MNLLLIIFLVVMLCNIVNGYKRGMVREIISFVSLIVMCVIVVLIANGVQSYLEKEMSGVIVAVLLLCVVGILHHLLGVAFFPAKMITKLPVIHWLDKLLGMAVGALETVLILWTVYTFIMFFGMGMIGHQILAYTQESELLSSLYQYNYLAHWIGVWGEEVLQSL